ncbi:MAG: arginase family protein [Actinobacteria bacterium]|nr:arginase family protein [Actinomycetota bacterium]
MQSTVLGPVGTLFGVPASTSAAAGRVAVLGVPFDMGYHPTRIGARGGPAHVRANSALVAEHLDGFGIDFLERLGVVDLGDVRVVPGDVEASYPAIEQAVAEIIGAGAVPLTFGGDGAVSLPQLRALKAGLGREFALLHVDAHTDAYPDIYPYEFNNANTFIHVATERLLDPSRSLHVGMRSTEYDDHLGVNQVARELGYAVITVDEIVAMGVDELVQRIRTTVGELPIYLCWDMDVFDPSFAPGVVTPSWGGITVREGLGLLRALRGLEFVAFDINTVSPPHDVQGITGSLAAQVAMECLFLVDSFRPGR